MLPVIKKVNTAIYGSSGTLPSSLSKEGHLSVREGNICLGCWMLSLFYLIPIEYIMLNITFRTYTISG